MEKMRRHEKKLVRWILTAMLALSLCVTPVVQTEAAALPYAAVQTETTAALTKTEAAVLTGSKKTGWQKKSAGRYEYYKSGKVTKKFVKGKNGLFRYYIKKDGTWKAQKKVWVRIGDNQYYINAKGTCSIMYFGAQQMVSKYSGGSWSYVKNGYTRLADKKSHYFNAKGLEVTTRGWYKITNTHHVYVNSAGDAVYVLKKVSGKWISYTDKTSGWTRTRSKWISAYGNMFYFNSYGVNSRIYYGKSKTCYEYSGGTYVMWKNAEKYVGSNLYYFGKDGVRVTTAGWHKVSSSREIYINGNGIVTGSRTPQTGLTASKTYTIQLANGKTTTVYGHFDTDVANELVKQLNEYRKENGLEELTVSEGLMQSARTRAYEISYLFDHSRPDGTMCYTASDEMNGENIAAGYRSATEVMTGWKNSPGHDENMKTNFRTIGIGVFVAESNDSNGYTYYYVQNFGY